VTGRWALPAHSHRAVDLYRRMGFPSRAAAHSACSLLAGSLMSFIKTTARQAISNMLSPGWVNGTWRALPADPAAGVSLPVRATTAAIARIHRGS
jgi:hypothetical protein